MTDELQARDKMTVEAEGEQTKAGPVFVPAVDIYESEEALTLVADMPGVNKENLTIDLKENTLTIKGGVPPSEDLGKVLYREYEEGDYYRQFTLSELIDQGGITAALKDGVLTLSLPKIKPAQPRRIEITS
jgi:HSP20 family protein